MRRYLPVLTLALLALAIPEVLFGATPLSEPGRILATMPIYAGGAILIRELARQRRAGWVGIALLGMVYGIVEEGLALGSIFNPNLYNAGLVGGRAFGVNWTWTEWTLGYHAVWSISIPILLTDLLFPARRAEPWLGKVGLAVAGLIYLAGAVFLGLIIRQFVAPGFDLSAIQYAGAGVIIVGLVTLALKQRDPELAPDPTAGAGAPTRWLDWLPSPLLAGAPSPWLVGLLALVVACAWFALLLLPAPIKSGGWVVVPMALALALLLGVVYLVRRWSATGRWTDLHRLALAAGPLPVSVWYGLTYVTASSPVDRAGEAAAGVLAIVLLALLAQRLRHRSATASTRNGPSSASGAVLASASR